LKISQPQITQCICPCIHEELIKECACPYCADIECELRALRTQFVQCKNKCESCKAWKGAISSVEKWLAHFSCSDEVLEGYERCGSTEQFTIRPFRCCLDPSDAKLTTPCSKCSDVKLMLPFGTCESFSKNNLEKDVTWLKRQPTIEGAKHDKLVSRLRKFKGKLSDLIESIFKKTKPFMAHLWRCRFIRRQFHLDCDFFDAATEAVILADFASQMVSFIEFIFSGCFICHTNLHTNIQIYLLALKKLGSAYKGTCESDATCNLYVVLVLYKKLSDDGSLEHVCDYVRIWSPAKSSAEFHHHALEQVLEHLKKKVPQLNRLRVWTDGHSSTYKGYPNFGRMVEFTRKHKVEIYHSFFESHHASGVQDSVGKDPRIAMTKAIGFSDTALYNYMECNVSLPHLSLSLLLLPFSFSNFMF
jgi:hypothetical protein